MKRLIALTVAVLLLTSPAYAALSIDGSAHGNVASSTSVASAFLNVTAGDEILAFVETNGGPFLSCTASVNGSLSFRQRSNPAGAAFPEEEWVLKATTTSAVEVVTCTSTSSAFGTIDVVSVAGVYPSAPFDGNASLPQAQTVTNTDVLISTTNASTLCIFGYRLSTATPTAGAGFTAVGTPQDFHLLEYKIVSSVQTNLDGTIGTGTGTNNGGIGDAVTDTSSGSSPQTRFKTLLGVGQ